jgi:hypothetical protein
MAPTTKNGIAIMNNTLGLKARLNESLRLEFQLGQAGSVAGLNTVRARSAQKMK